LPIRTSDGASGPRCPYLVNLWVDAFFIGGFCLLFLLAERKFHFSLSLLWMEFFLWGIIWPHFFASYYRISNPEDGGREHPFLRYALPVILMAVVCGVCFWGKPVVPWYLVVGLLWRLYHGASQSFGVGIIYAKRCGFLDRGIHRSAIAWLTYGGYIVTALKYPGTFWPYALNTSAMPPPHLAWFYQTYQWIWLASRGIFLTTASLMGILCIAWCWRHRRILNPLFLVPILTPYLIMRESPQSGAYQLQSLYHALQYLFIVWALYTRADRATSEVVGSVKKLLTKSLRLLVANFSGGALLYGILLVVAGLLSKVSLPWIVCYFVVSLAIESHHFITDAFVWKVNNHRTKASLLVAA